MGSATSNVKPQTKKYTDAEIRANINQLFSSGISNNFSEASYSIKDLENIVVSDIPFNLPPPDDYLVASQPLTGGNIKFNSSKNRHLRHNIDDYVNGIQKGGEGEKYEEISDISEFQKIKEYLINDMKNNQTGGHFDDDSFNIIGSPASESENKSKMTFLNAMIGGFIGGVDPEDDDDDGLEFEEDGPELEVPEIQEPAAEISPTSSEEKGVGEYSETSYDNNNQSSELHILPFYSSDSSINKNPYTKNRMN